MKVNPALFKFIAPYDERIQNLTLDLRKFVTDLVPEANELIWDNYNAVAMAYSKSEKLKDAFCHIAVNAQHVNFGFNRGTELTNVNLKLEGKGKLIRHLTVKNIESFPKEEIKHLIDEALAIADSRNPAIIKKKELGQSMVMSISSKKIRPGKG